MDKAALFVGGATPSRSISSLDVRLDFDNQPLASTLGLLMVVFWLGLADSIQRLTRRIRDAYPVLWGDLGMPESLSFSWLLGPFIFTFLLAGRPEFVRWLVTGQHRFLQDAELAKYVARLRFFFSIFTATVITSILYATYQLAFM
jgi:hypothetical protein